MKLEEWPNQYLPRHHDSHDSLSDAGRACTCRVAYSKCGATAHVFELVLSVVYYRLVPWARLSVPNRAFKMAATAPKRSLFNRPAWASSTNALPESKDASTFGRQQVYGDILELERQKREKRESKAKARAEKEEAKREDAARQEAEPKAKKRRISEKDEDDSDDQSSRANSQTSKSGQDDSSSETPHKRVTRSTPTKNKALRRGPGEDTGSKTGVINLEEDYDDDLTRTATPTKTSYKPKPSPRAARSKPVPLESESEEEDGYLRELKQKAREKARLQQSKSVTERTAASASAVDVGNTPILGQSQINSSHSSTIPENAVASTTTPSAESDPEVALFIKSVIANTKPLVVNRRISQNLQQVREAWCHKQGFELAFSARIFFAWRGVRLFNSTTPRSLIQRLKAEAGESPNSGADPSFGKITLEAMTQEIYDERQKAAQRKAASKAAGEDAYSEMAMPEAAPVEVAPKKEGIVLRLVCKDLEPFPLRVRPNTSVAKIMKAFSHQRMTDKTMECHLFWDGDRLDPAQSAEEVGFENNDEVEVHPK